jgi:predicted  nucleic acid-binding Zn-ribbon protein
MFIQYWNHACTHCGKVYASTLSRQLIFIGTGMRECRKCKAQIADNSKEWDEMKPSEKFLFVVPNGAMIPLGLALLCGLVGFLFGESATEKLTLGATLFVVFASPVLPMWIVRWFQVRASRRRQELKARQALGMGA